MQNPKTEIIDLVKCPYCTKGIRADIDFICAECTPLYEIDMATQSLMNANDILQKNRTKISVQRQKDINRLLHLRRHTY